MGWFDSIASSVSSFASSAIRGVTQTVGSAVKSIGSAYSTATRTVSSAASYASRTAAGVAGGVSRSLSRGAQDIVKTVVDIPKSVPTYAFPTLPSVSSIQKAAGEAVKTVSVSLPQLPVIQVPSVSSIQKAAGEAAKVVTPVVALPVGAAGLGAGAAALSSALSGIKLPDVSKAAEKAAALPNIAVQHAVSVGEKAVAAVTPLPNMAISAAGGALSSAGGAIASIPVLKDADTGLRDIAGRGVLPDMAGIIDTVQETKLQNYEEGFANLFLGETPEQRAAGAVVAGGTLAVDAVLPLDLVSVGNKVITGRLDEVTTDEVVGSVIDVAAIALGAFTGGAGYIGLKGLKSAAKGGKALKAAKIGGDMSYLKAGSSFLTALSKSISGAGTAIKTGTASTASRTRQLFMAAQRAKLAQAQKAAEAAASQRRAAELLLTQRRTLAAQQRAISEAAARAAKPSTAVSTAMTGAAKTSLFAPTAVKTSQAAASIPIAATKAGDDIIAAITKSGDDIIASITKSGDDIIASITKSGDEAASAITKASDDAIAGISKTAAESSKLPAQSSSTLSKVLKGGALVGAGILGGQILFGGGLGTPTSAGTPADVVGDGEEDLSWWYQLLSMLGMGGGELPDYGYVPLPDGGYIIDPGIIPPDQEIPDDWYIYPGYPGGEYLAPAEYVAQDGCEILDGLPLIGGLFAEAKRRGIALPVLIGVILLIAGGAYFFLRTRKGKAIVRKVKGVVA